MGAVTQVGVYDAKAQLSDLIKRVMAGERITITIHGRPVVDLVPAENDDKLQGKAASAKALLEFMENTSKTRKAISNSELTESIRAGRR